MNDPLFQIDSGAARKRKAQAAPGKKGGAAAKAQGSKKPRDEEDDAIHSDEDAVDAQEPSDAESEEEDRETAAEKRVRLAREYLEKLKQKDEDDDSDREIDHDAISHRLRQEHLEAERKVDRNIAHKLTRVPAEASIKRLRNHAHKLPITCLALSHNERYLYTASKDCRIIKWDLATSRRVGVIPKGTQGKHDGHYAHILALAVSTDGKFLVSGGRDRSLYVWDAGNLRLLKELKHHRDAISGLVFRKGTHTVYSSSFDRTVKIWDLDQMCYMETLFGHQDSVTAIDSLFRETCVTVGGRDRTARLYKIADESQLVFNGHVLNTECVRMVNEQMFVSCGEDGCINLWTTFKKKPACCVQAAHKRRKRVATNDEAESEGDESSDEQDNAEDAESSDVKDGDAAANGEEASAMPPPGVISVAALPYTDLIASGSSTGELKLWRITPDKKLEEAMVIPTPGYINCLAFAPSGKFLVAGIGQEHRLGRWERIKAARNEIRIIPLVGGNDGQEEDGDDDEDSEEGDEAEAQGSDDE